jgi:O-6-methylguanine DNA methyltransferase
MKHYLVELTIATSDGEFVACYSETGLACLSFPSKRRTISPNAAVGQIRQWHQQTTAALKRALAGSARGTLPPLDLSSGTDFQQSVWRALRQIRTGQTRSYGEIARAIGKPKALRAVGGACGANPIPVFVPCHRVLAANRKIGGFSGGLDWKWTLLQREGVKGIA